MRFLLLNTDYPEFLAWLYGTRPGLGLQAYETQRRAREEALFGDTVSYARSLRKLGHKAWVIHVNNKFMQKAWAREHGVSLPEPGPAAIRATRILARAARAGRQFLPSTIRSLAARLGHALSQSRGWLYDLPQAQIRHFRPDVLLNLNLGCVDKQFLMAIKPDVRLLVGQHAATPLSPGFDLGGYDLIFTSFPPTLEDLGRRGIASELIRLAFEPSILHQLRTGENTFDVTFVGSLQKVHRSRAEWLTAIASHFPQLKIWGPRSDYEGAGPYLRKCYVGPAWGGQMYEITAQSKIALNHHGDVPPHANNLRLFEATGVGTLLITDWKPDLHQLFEPGREVVAYRSPEECTEQIRYYLDHEKERKAIAARGRQRTLREHTHLHRAREMVEIIRSQMAELQP